MGTLRNESLHMEEEKANSNKKAGLMGWCKEHLRLSPEAGRGFVLLFPLLLLLGYGPTLFRHLLHSTSTEVLHCPKEVVNRLPSIPLADPMEPVPARRTFSLPPATKTPPTQDGTERKGRKRDINAAVAADLTTVRYIGAVLSQRIVDYRDRLGGYYHLRQLHEVKRLSGRAIKEIKKAYRVKDPCCQKIPINRASAEVLSTHPYLSPEVARAIVAQREKQPLSDHKALLGILQGDKTLLAKVKAYVRYD